MTEDHDILHQPMYLLQVENQLKGDVGMHNAKNHSKIVVQSCVTPEPELCREGLASVPCLPRYAVLLASVNCARAGHIENGEGLG